MPVVVSSSRPSSPRNTFARDAAASEHLGHQRQHPRVRHADDLGERPAGLVSGPRKLNDGGHAELTRGPAPA